MAHFENKTLLITGGTGSFGNAVLNRILSTDIGEIRILSRDEKKQDDMRHEYQAKMPAVSGKIKFYIGDVRDYNSIVSAFRGVDYVFHAAALKQVPSCEFYPMEAVKTNIQGSDNVISACVENHVQKAIFLSTLIFIAYSDIFLVIDVHNVFSPRPYQDTCTLLPMEHSLPAHGQLSPYG